MTVTCLFVSSIIVNERSAFPVGEWTRALKKSSVRLVENERTFVPKYFIVGFLPYTKILK